MKARGFHRSDFTGSEGPGLAKLRAAREASFHAEEDCIARLDAREDRLWAQSKLAKLRELMAAGEWEAAILLAARWADAPEAAKQGREAIQRPAFQRQLRRDPAQLIEAAKAALLARYGAER